MQRSIDTIAPAFIATAHRIGMAVAATVDRRGDVHTRVVQPVWTWDRGTVTGWISTDTRSPKYAQLQHAPTISVTYWNPQQDTCTADGVVELVDDPATKIEAWDRFLSTPPPAGFDPAIHPDWDSPSSPTFGLIAVRPTWLRVMPGTLMTHSTGEVWTWRAR